MNQTHIAAAIAVQSGAPGMAIGGNLGSLSSYAPYIFNNVLLQAGEWQRYSGSGSFVQQCGVLTPTVGTDVFRAYISDSGTNLPTGTYTVFNPDGCNIAIGGFTPPSEANWTTATQFNFTYTSGSGLVALWCRGLAGFTANTGRSGIIAPFDAYSLSDWQSGNIWRRDFLSYLSNLKLKTIRFMDALGPTYYNIEDSWGDRTPAEPVSIRNRYSNTGSWYGGAMSYEMIADLCNRVGAEPYLTLPVRLHDAYVQNIATTLDSKLNSGKRVWVEYGNELWNPGNAYVEAMQWATWLPFTKFTAGVDYANQKFTLASHGLSAAEPISVFPSRGNRDVNAGQSWAFTTGATLYASPVDSDSFRIYMTPSPVSATITRSGTTAQIAIPNSGSYSSSWILEVTGADQSGYNGTFNLLSFSGGVATYTVSGTETTPATGNIKAWVRPNITSTQVDQLFVRNNESGKSSNRDTNIGNRSLEIWNLMQAAAPSRKIVSVMGAWAVNTGTITGRLAPAGVNAATNYAAIATYWGTEVHGWRLSMSSGSVTPQAYCRLSGKTVYSAIFPPGTVPTRTMVKNGTGAVGYSSRATTGTSGSWDSFTSVTVTNGTSYVAAFVLVDAFGYEWLSYGNFTAATSGTVSINPTNANELLRNKIDIYKNFKSWIDSHVAVLSGPKVMCYEGGADYFCSPPTEVSAWRSSYLESAENGQAVSYNLRMLSAMGVKAFNQFNLMDAGVWGWASDYTDTSDNRYQNALPFAGKSKKLKMPTVADISAAQITTQPSYPYTVTSLSDSAAVHTIIQGNDSGNFSVSGNTITMVAGSGVNWSNPSLNVLRVISEKNGLLATQTVQFYTGYAWYEVDAKFAFDSVSDTDPAAINPAIGANPVPYTTASAATVSNSLWDMDGVCYGSSTALLSTIPMNVPFFIASVLDKDNMGSTGYAALFQVGAGSQYISYSTDAGADSYFCAKMYVLSGSVTAKFKSSGTLPTGAHVYWVYGDGAGNITAGIDQTSGNSAYRAPGTSAFGPGLYVGSGPDGVARSAMKHGSIQVLSRAGLTITDAKAIVAKMQALHGIS